jgi:hypothetical protein
MGDVRRMMKMMNAGIANLDCRRLLMEVERRNSEHGQEY